MKCDIIIPIWNQKDITKDCIESIIRNTRYPYRLILIDNASDETAASYLAQVRDKKGLDVTLIRNEKNLGFVKAVNQGLEVSAAGYVCIFNNDTVTTPGWLEEMMAFAEAHKDIGIINPLCNGPSDIPKDEYARLIAGQNKGKFMEMNQCFFFCALIKREVIDKIGNLDEVFGMGCFDDTDYSMRAHLAGYRCVCLHSAVVYHIENVSFSALGRRDRIAAECEKEYFKKWPRHTRAAVIFSLSKDTSDNRIANMLRVILRLAREWCWINLWIFGDKTQIKTRLEKVSANIDMPLHQNIKFNSFPASGKIPSVLIRLIERSFGTKRRKRYDILIADDAGSLRLVNALKFLHGARTVALDFGNDKSLEMDRIIKNIRGAA
jgi:GT2 family glycosyltransferase